MEPEKNLCGNGCSCIISVEEYLKEAIDIVQKNGALFILDDDKIYFRDISNAKIAK